MADHKDQPVSAAAAADSSQKRIQRFMSTKFWRNYDETCRKFNAQQVLTKDNIDRFERTADQVCKCKCHSNSTNLSFPCSCGCMRDVIALELTYREHFKESVCS